METDLSVQFFPPLLRRLLLENVLTHNFKQKAQVKTTSNFEKISKVKNYGIWIWTDNEVTASFVD